MVRHAESAGSATARRRAAPHDDRVLRRDSRDAQRAERSAEGALAEDGRELRFRCRLAADRGAQLAERARGLLEAAIRQLEPSCCACLIAESQASAAPLLLLLARAATAAAADAVVGGGWRLSVAPCCPNTWMYVSCPPRLGGGSAGLVGSR